MALAFCFASQTLQADVTKMNLALVEFERTPIAEAVEFFRGRSRQSDPQGKGINIVVDGDVDQQRTVSLRLRDVSIGVALIHFFDHAGLDYRIDPHACLVLPGGSANIAPHPTPGPATLRYAAKAKRLKLDRIEFNDAPLHKVVRHLADRSAQLDQQGTGINLVLGAGVEPELPVSLQLINISLAEVIGFVAKDTGLEIRLAPKAVFLEYPLPAAPRAIGTDKGSLPKPKRPPIGKNSPLSTIPNDPRSPAHPDYVGPSHRDPSKRTNSLGNSYKWVNGRWTFVRYDGSLQMRDKNKQTLDSTKGFDSPRR